MFGFRPGAYSYAHGKVALFEDLRVMATRAVADRDSELLDRIFEYVVWADRQNAENLRSTADLVFFIPMLADKALLREATARVPPSVLVAKRALVRDERSM